MSAEVAQTNDMTQWVRKMTATLDVEVRDYYNHCKVEGEDLLDAYETLHRHSPQPLDVTWKDGGRAMAVNIQNPYNR